MARHCVLGAMIAFVAVFALMSSAKGAANEPALDLSPIGVSYPFAASTAVDSLRKLARDNGESISAKEAERLTAIHYIGYDFKLLPRCDLGSPACDGYDGKWVRSHRRIEYRFSGLADQINRQLNRQEDHGCSSLTFGRPRRMATSRDALRYVASVNATKRYCWDFFGRRSIDLASGSGHVLITATMRKTPPRIRPGGSIGAYRIRTDVRADVSTNKILGLINAQSLVGKLFSTLVKINIPMRLADHLQLNHEISATYDALTGKSLGLGVTWEAAEQNRALRGVDHFYAVFSSWGNVEREYFLDVEQTGFSTIRGEPGIQIVTFAVTPTPGFPYYRPAVDQEIRLLESLDDPDQVTTVRRGDNLWHYTIKNYSLGSAAYALGAFNNIRDPELRLHPGQRIVIPAYWKIARLTPRLIRPGETIWSRYVARYDPASWDPKRAARPLGAKSPDQVFPMQVSPY